MRTHRLLVVAALLAPCPATAQSTTVDGIQALTRGDYVTAARILRPLAEDASPPDPLALFFMATLYESGRGVAMDQTRACGLYLRAATPTNPLQAQSLALAQMIHRDVPVMRDLCAAVVVGPSRNPPAASFTLGPDHWMRIDREGFVVRYRGAQKTAALTIGGPGGAFLPARHTPLDVSRPVPIRRHFIEFFVWMPQTVSDQRSWSLWWAAKEIVGTETLDVPGAGILVTLTATQPPLSVTVEDIARIRVNAEGEAEWAVSGPNPHGGVIPYTGPR
jgi:hypothetical protein